MSNRKILIIVLAAIIVGCIIANVYMLSTAPTEEEFTIEGIETVENKEILKDATVEDLNITNVSLLTRNGISTYTAEIANTRSNTVHIDKLYVVFYENETENKVLGLTDIDLKANTGTHITITSESDLSKTTNIEYIME